MEISMSQQLSAIIISLITGVILGAIYDVVRIIRCILGVKYTEIRPKISLFKNKPKKSLRISGLTESLIIHITDVLFFIVCGIIIAITVYFSNSGRVRWFIYFFCVLGFLAYYFTVGKIVIKLSGTITEILKTAVYSFVYLLFYPFFPIVSIIKGVTHKMIEGCKVRRINEKKKKDLIKRNVLINYGK